MAPTFVLLLLCVMPLMTALPEAVGIFECELPVAVEISVLTPLDWADALFTVKKFQSDGLDPRNAGSRSSLGQTPLLLQGLELQQPQKVGCVALQE
jgi:hypothetical protein